MNLNDLPLGPMYLTFAEEREVECGRCKGNVMNQPTCRCGNTGRKRIRVRGAVEVVSCEVENPGWDVTFRSRSFDVMPYQYQSHSTDGLITAVITAYLAGDLPGDVAKFIEREDV